MIISLHNYKFDSPVTDYRRIGLLSSTPDDDI